MRSEDRASEADAVAARIEDLSPYDYRSAGNCSKCLATKRQLTL